MSDPNPLTAYDRFVWKRIVDTARAWRNSTSVEFATDFERAGKLAWRATMPWPPGSQQAARVLALVEASACWVIMSLHQKNAQWPWIAAALPVIDEALAKSPLEPTPAPGRSAAPRGAVDGLDAVNLPYWVE